MSVVIAANVFSQFARKDNYNYLAFEGKSYYFGLTMGVNTSKFHLNKSERFINNSEFRIAESSNKLGFNLNMIANLKLGEFFDFRFLPGFTFTEKSLLYTEVGSENLTIEPVESVNFDLPFQIRYKSVPYKNKRVYVLGGIKYSYDVASNSKSKKTIMKFSPHDFQFEIGLGVQLFYPYFIFSPEIKFSRGLTNTLIYDSSLPQSDVLENIVSQYFTISFHFEG